jgi:ABC-type glycerol-3-phosphate transport system permease component
MIDRHYTRIPERVAVALAAWGLVAILALPFFWLVITALKPLPEVLVYPPRWWPSKLQWSNFRDAWTSVPFARFYVNSLVTATIATTFQVAFAALMAYAFCWLRFPGKSLIYLAVLSTLMVPEEMKLLPNYLLLARLGWIDTYTALIVPAMAHAFPVFVLHQQFRALPKDYLDAARIDGAGHLQLLLAVVAPLARPLLVATALIAFLGRWNDYLWPLVATNRLTMRTVPVGLAYLKQVEEQGMPHWNVLMAGAIIATVPVLIAYAFAQRHFVAGLAQGGLKS